MKENNCVLGGEQSGHIIFSENFQVWSIHCFNNIRNNKQTKLPLSKFKNLFNKLPQHLVNYKLFNNSDII